MNTINKNVCEELIIKKSKFITYLFCVNSTDEINYWLKKISTINKGYSHLCYAYIFDNIKKYSDDNEPNGTAGIPMLNILEKNNLTNILAIVIRYFGGIKLGTSGLIRAYSTSVKNCLDKTSIIEYKNFIKIELTTKQENLKLLNALTKDYEVIGKIFNNEITYLIRTSTENYPAIKDKFKETNIVCKKKEEN